MKISDNDPRLDRSLCWNVTNLGWVSVEDFQDDVEISAVWPDWGQKLYGNMSRAMVKKALTTSWGKALFFSTAYLYINAANGVDSICDGRIEEAHRVLALPPFMCLILPAFLVGVVLNILEK